MDTTSRAGAAAVVALKAGDAVKSRLGVLPEGLRHRLAWAMAVDTFRALSSGVAHLLVVSDRVGLADDLARAGITAEILPEPDRSGMNDALRHGDAKLRADGWRTVVASVGDLPALRSSTVGEVIAMLTESERAYVPDRSGTGTTMLLARQAPLDPRFQGPSAAAHAASGARCLSEVSADARCDVDTVADLAVAMSLGVGSATHEVVITSADIRSRLG